MKRKYYYIIVLILFVVGFVIADTLQNPTPKYKILGSYPFNDMICLKISGYSGIEPCFTSTEFVFENGNLTAQSLINLHSRMTEIDGTIQINNERTILNNKPCIKDNDCIGLYATNEYKCYKSKCTPIMQIPTALE